MAIIEKNLKEEGFTMVPRFRYLKQCSLGTIMRGVERKAIMAGCVVRQTPHLMGTGKQ